MENTEIMKETKSKKALKTSIIGNLSLAFIFFASFTLPALREGLYFNLNSCFYTDGLFERSGFEFFREYIFELPFALGRWCGNIGMIPFVLFFVIISIYEICKYRKNK